MADFIGGIYGVVVLIIVIGLIAEVNDRRKFPDK